MINNITQYLIFIMSFLTKKAVLLSVGAESNIVTKYYFSSF